MELTRGPTHQPVSFEETFFRKVFSHPLGEPLLAVYLHQQELVGARWILELPIHSWSEKIHQHAREEMRHAELLHTEAARQRSLVDPERAHQMNSMSNQVFAATEEYMRTIFEASLKAIIQASSITKITGDQKRVANYYVLSFLLERRIMKTYPYIARLAHDASFVQTAKKIIKDEKDHLSEVMDGIEKVVTPYGLDLAAVSLLEEEAYQKFTRSFLDFLEAHP